MNYRIKIVIILILLFSGLAPLYSQEKPKAFRDTLDVAFDISRWLFELHGFIPLVSPITEPAVGYGLSLGGLYFIPKKDTVTAKFKMPDVVGLMGGFTQNKTWFAGGGYAGFWKDDHIRYRGFVGYANINLKYYGVGDAYFANNPANFTLKSAFLLQQVLVRIKNSKFLLGGKYVFGRTEISAFENNNHPEIEARYFDLINSGLGIISEFETLDNVFSPTKGIRLHLSFTQALEILGSDNNNNRLTFFSLNYLPVTKGWISGFRVESQLASDNTPFYMLPFIDLRGIPALRYQGELTLMLETEQQFKLYRRWSVLGFGGYGTAFPSIDALNAGINTWNAGGGIRYLLARVFGLQAGMDVARGPEDWAFYFVLGSSWLK